MKLKIKDNKKGFTLVEILLVVGFIAIATIGIYVIYQKVNDGGKANAEGRHLDTLRAGIKNLFGVNNNFVGLNNTVSNNANITPQDMRDGTADGIVNSFGGAVTILPGNCGAGNNNCFTIRYDNVPAGVCTKLVPTAGSQFDAVDVGGQVGAAGNVKQYGTNTMNAADVARDCGGFPAAGGSIVFTSN